MEPPAVAAGAARLERLDLPLRGTPDDLHADRIAARLQEIFGVHGVVVNAIAGRVAVLFDGTRTRADIVVRVLGETGAEPGRGFARWHARVPELACGACTEEVERRIEATPGIHAARVNRTTGNLTVEFVARRTDLRALGQLVRSVSEVQEGAEP
ncbi:MAG: heavy-metal-associated domain-containing protein [Gemmatimonadota bacterium]